MTDPNNIKTTSTSNEQALHHGELTTWWFGVFTVASPPWSHRLGSLVEVATAGVWALGFHGCGKTLGSTQCAFGTHVFRAFLLFAKKQWVSCTIHKTRKYSFLVKNILKLGLTVLFTHLKIILLKYFQFLTISGIQTDPKLEVKFCRIIFSMCANNFVSYLQKNLGVITLPSLEIWRNDTLPQTWKEKTLPFLEVWKN